MWHTMAYAVAKELAIKPTDILYNWTCEELLVAFGVYANQNSVLSYEMTSKKERHQKGMTPLDRWAIPFVSANDMAEINKQQQQDNAQLEDMTAIAQALFG